MQGVHTRLYTVDTGWQMWFGELKFCDSLNAEVLKIGACKVEETNKNKLGLSLKPLMQNT